MKRSIPLCVVLAAGALAADLPVREVVLYKHGVGYFERAGQLAAGESARLDFKATEMNDVLKSLTVEEKGGGKKRKKLKTEGDEVPNLEPAELPPVKTETGPSVKPEKPNRKTPRSSGIKAEKSIGRLRSSRVKTEPQIKLEPQE